MRCHQYRRSLDMSDSRAFIAPAHRVLTDSSPSGLL